MLRSHLDETIAQADDLPHARGNALVAAAAKAAVGKLHPSCDPLWCQEAEAEVDEAWAILQLVGWIAAEWQRPPKTAARKADAAAAGHRTAADRPTHTAVRPPAEARCHSTHLLWRAQQGVTVCGRCGAFTTGGKVVSLPAPCRQNPAPGGASAKLARLASGRPLTGGRPTVPPMLADASL